MFLVLAEAFEALQAIFVHRGGQGSHGTTVNEICRRAQSNGEWPHILLFPEGSAKIPCGVSVLECALTSLLEMLYNIGYHL